MEKDDEVKGSGNSLNYGARIHDPRLGRWLTVDPQTHKYPYINPYNFAINSPLQCKDPDGGDVILIIWATTPKENGVAARYGHAAIAVSNYKTENYKVIENGVEVTKSRQVKDGTYTYYDLWPGKDTDGDGKADTDGSAGPTDAFTGPPALYQIFKTTKKGSNDAIKENDLINDDMSRLEGRPPDGVIKLNSEFDEDMETVADLKAHMAMPNNFQYTSVTNNCSNLAATGVSENLDTYPGLMAIYEYYLIISYITPNALYKNVQSRINANPSEGKELKNPGNKVNNTFYESIIKPSEDKAKSQAGEKINDGGISPPGNIPKTAG